jgi:hypothetical protein
LFVAFACAGAGLGLPDEQKILFAFGGGMNGIFTKIVVDLQPAVRPMPDQASSGRRM